MIIALTVLIVLFIVVLCCGISMDEGGGFVCGVMGGVMLTLISVLIVLAIRGERIEVVPSAMDVSQNKTVLQITCQDSVTVDTVVVFRKEE